MNRDYESGQTSEALIFSGIEIEKTSFHNQKTLFVVDVQPIKDIVHYALQEECSHVYLGANHSANNGNLQELIKQAKVLMYQWEMNVTLDIDISLYEQACGIFSFFGEIIDKKSFCLIVSCKLPNIGNLRNAFIKVDDKDFKFSNRGVWLHEAVQESVETSWSEYSKDKILKEK